MPELSAHLDYLREAHAAAVAAPLSARRAMLVALLIDAYVDRLFAARTERDDDDVLMFRKALGAGSEALALVMDLCALREGGPRLVTEAVAVPLREYGALAVEDFMVSLYNDQAVQRVRIVTPNGGRRDVLEVLAEAVGVLAG